MKAELGFDTLGSTYQIFGIIYLSWDDHDLTGGAIIVNGAIA